MKKRVLSGIRPTGTNLHLGNYLGAVKGMIELQNNSEYETTFTVVDIHATTTPFDPSKLREQTRNVFIDYLACGLDPEKSAINIQSDLADLITQLAFYFSSVTTMAKMQHLPTFKDKVKQHPDNVTMALLNYPLLMTADILIYKASMVPVGVDQEPHLEVAREVARRMNADFGTDFPEPQRFVTAGGYVPSLAGEGKMSKSVEGSYINITDDLATIQKRLSGAPTDGGTGTIETMPQSVKNLLAFVELFEGTEKRKEYESMYSSTGIRYGDLKKSLAEAIFLELEPIQNKRKELAANQDYVDQVIAQGAEKSRIIADQTINEVKQKMGLA